MLRDATRAVAAAVRQLACDAALQTSVVGGDAETERFIFAGERALLTLAARFDMRVRLERPLYTVRRDAAHLAAVQRLRAGRRRGMRTASRFAT